MGKRWPDVGFMCAEKRKKMGETGGRRYTKPLLINEIPEVQRTTRVAMDGLSVSVLPLLMIPSIPP